MAYYARSQFIGNGVIRAYVIGFPFQFQRDVDVYVHASGDPLGTPKVAGVDYTWTSPNTITFTVAPANLAVIDIRRTTNEVSLDNTMTGGGSVRAREVAQNDQQMQFLIQEAMDALAELTQTALGTQGIPGPKGDPGSAGQGYATRAAMALAGNTATNLFDAYLTEPGHEGKFVYSTANLSAKVTADPRQGIYVSQAADPTGASGAWVRKYDGDIFARWFGMAVDNATDDAPAIQAAVTLANALATSNLTGYGTASPTVQLPGGGIYCGSKISLGGALGAPTSSVRLIGEHSGYGRSATILRFPANITGIEIFAPSCAVEQMAILGGWVFGTTAEGEYHGVKFHYLCTLRNLFLQNWQGDLIHGIVSSGSGGDTEGIANELYLERLSGETGRCGLYLEGSDVNAGNIIAMNFNSCRRASVYDISFLGNLHLGHQSSGTGTYQVGSGVPYLACFNNGHLFQVKQGQAAGASANSPPATATSNAYWKFWKDAAAQSYAPQWVGGMSVRDGGAYVFAGTSTVANPYSEQGEVPGQYTPGVLVLNGDGLPDDGTVSSVRASQALGGVEVGPLAYVKGNLTQEQGTNNQFLLDGTVKTVDTSFVMDSGNIADFMFFRVGGVTHAQVVTTPGQLATWVDTHAFNTLAGARLLTLSAATVNMGPGVSLQADGVQVVGARSTGWAADTGTAEKGSHATYTAPAISNPPTQAEVQAIAAALQNFSRGQMALKAAATAHGLIGA